MRRCPAVFVLVVAIATGMERSPAAQPPASTKVKTLSVEQAKTLATVPGDLPLNGLTEISDDVAEALALHRGNLYLNGVSELTDIAAKALATKTDRTFVVQLGGLKTASEEAIVLLSTHPKIGFPPKYYSELLFTKPHKLKRLTLIDATLLGSGRFMRPLDLNGVTLLSDEQAEALSYHRGGFLALNGLTRLSGEAIISLAKHQGDLYLNGLTTLSEEDATALSRHQGLLFLQGLKEISTTAFVTLGTHVPPNTVSLSPDIKVE